MAILCVLLFNACAVPDQGSTGNHNSVPVQSEPAASPLPESGPPSAVRTPTIEPVPSLVPTSPVEVMASGICGKNAMWTLDAEGTLTISGSGAVYNYIGYATDVIDADLSQYAPPWNKYYDNQLINTVIIEPGITSIGVGAFMTCPNLVNVSIPSSVTKVDGSAFADCPMLTSIDFPSGVVELGGWAFAGCTGLISVSLPATLRQIEQEAFGGCVNISEINYGGTAQQWKDAKVDAVDFGSKDYTIQFNDGSSYRYVYQEPMSQDEAHIFAYRYWGVDPDEAKEFGSDIWPAEGSGITKLNGRTYYAFKQYGVGTATYVWATQNEDISMIFIDAITGEAFTNLF
jgi:hypothetical protein